MIPHGVPSINGNTDKPLWLIVLKHLEVRLSLWLEYRFWPWASDLFRDGSRVSRSLGIVGWLLGVMTLVYLLAHVLLAGKRGYFSLW